jgi:hypothetical protein
VVDVPTAKHHGICPDCEGYGGNSELEGCPNEDCIGSCPSCWCPGCHDGAVECDLDPEERPGSWQAYEAVQGSKEAELK